ncbi:MAG: DUF167 domain-containing protein [Gaiellales bacterium]
MAANGETATPVARVQLRAAPGAARTLIVGRHGDGWKVRIAAAPEKGRANAEICAFLAKLAGVHKRDVDVITGASSRDKLIEVRGIDSSTLEGLLDGVSGK